MLNDKIIKKNFAFSALPASSSALNQYEISFPQESEQKYSAFLPSVHKPEQGMPKISRALNDEVVFHSSVPHSRSQNVVVAWTAVAAKKHVGEPSCPVPDKSLGIKKKQSGTKLRHCRKAPKNGSPFRLAQASNRLCAVKKGKRLFFLLGSHLKSPWNNAQGSPRTQSRKKLSEPTATPHSSFYLSCREEILKTLFPGSELFFLPKESFRHAPESKQPPHGF